MAEREKEMEPETKHGIMVVDDADGNSWEPVALNTS